MSSNGNFQTAVSAANQAQEDSSVQYRIAWLMSVSVTLNIAALELLRATDQSIDSTYGYIAYAAANLLPVGAITLIDQCYEDSLIMPVVSAMIRLSFADLGRNGFLTIFYVLLPLTLIGQMAVLGGNIEQSAFDKEALAMLAAQTVLSIFGALAYTGILRVASYALQLTVGVMLAVQLWVTVLQLDKLSPRPVQLDAQPVGQPRVALLSADRNDGLRHRAGHSTDQEAVTMA